MTPQYRTLLHSLMAMFYLRATIDIKGRENLPPGPAILATNHLSNWDPVALGMALLHMQFSALGKRELFELPLLGRLAYWTGGIPVDRGAVSRETIKACCQCLAGGTSLLILPEGTRSRTRTMNEGKLGIVLIAQLARVPIVPIGVWGTEDMGTILRGPFRRAQVHVNIGKPIVIERSARSPEAREAALLQTMSSIAALLPPAYRGVYAAPSAEPEPLAAQGYGVSAGAMLGA